MDVMNPAKSSSDSMFNFFRSRNRAMLMDFTDWWVMAAISFVVKCSFKNAHSRFSFTVRAGKRSANVL